MSPSENREIYAEGSTRYRNPQARLLEGLEWDAVKDDVLTTLGLPEHPDEMLASYATGLDEALTYVAGRLAANTDVRVDEAGKIHLSSDKALEDPSSLIDLRKRIAAMLAYRPWLVRTTAVVGGSVPRTWRRSCVCRGERHGRRPSSL